MEIFNIIHSCIKYKNNHETAVHAYMHTQNHCNKNRQNRDVYSQKYTAALASLTAKSLRYEVVFGQSRLVTLFLRSTTLLKWYVDKIPPKWVHSVPS